jgi:hypothetical protein
MGILGPFGYNPPDNKPPPPVEPLNTHEERVKLTDLSIGEKGQMAAHETSGVLRAHRAGASGPALAYILGCSMRSLKHEFKLGLDLETEAALQGMPIYDSGLPKTAK